MDIDPLPLGGCYTLQPRVFQDLRGSFVKSLVASEFEARGLRTDFVEQYHSTSRAGVIRGMHFQVPPLDHAKLVYCASGAVNDVLLDLRYGSPTFGQSCAVALSCESGAAVYLPSGIAHGFIAVREPALMVYNVTAEYSSTHDTGIRWDSFGFDWGISSPIVSDRDRGLPTFASFTTPFAS